MPPPNTDLSEAITYCNRKVKGTSLVRIFRHTLSGGYHREMLKQQESIP
jgi:hypothetical protein